MNKLSEPTGQKSVPAKRSSHAAQREPTDSRAGKHLHTMHMMQVSLNIRATLSLHLFSSGRVRDVAQLEESNIESPEVFPT